MALQADGWYLRRPIIWQKKGPMPESTKDRPTRSYEYVLLLAKAERYFYDGLAIAEPLARPNEADRKTPAKFGGADKHVEAGKQSRLHSGNEYRGTPTGTRNCRDVWTISTQSSKLKFYAAFPEKLAERCILAGSSARGCCPQCGTGWVRVLAPKPKGADPSTGRNSRMFQDRDPDHSSERKQREWRGTWSTQDEQSSGRRIGLNTLAARQATGSHDQPFQGAATLGWRPGCSCAAPPGVNPKDLDVIASPLCRDETREDPSLEVGRAGYSRPRREGEGCCYVTRYEQRQYAEQLKLSPYRAEMEAEAGSAFAHYVRTDRSGARPVPHDLLKSWIGKGWLTRVVMPVWDPPSPVPCTVLDPFSGAGTTCLVAQRLGRRSIGIELSPEYVEMSRVRIAQEAAKSIAAMGPDYVHKARAKIEAADDSQMELFDSQQTKG
jgi:hypothetical protein